VFQWFGTQVGSARMNELMNEINTVKKGFEDIIVPVDNSDDFIDEECIL
jgi:hypothetical protein